MGRKIAYTGMLLAVDVTIFLMVNLFQANTIFLLGLASLPIAIVIMNWGPKTGIVFYLASVILSFTGNKTLLPVGLSPVCLVPFPICP